MEEPAVDEQFHVVHRSIEGSMVPSFFPYVKAL